LWIFEFLGGFLEAGTTEAFGFTEFFTENTELGDLCANLRERASVPWFLPLNI
jgi:hypothetical protein